MLQAFGRGIVIVDTEVKHRVKTITIKDVLHVPKLKAKLLLVTHLVLKCLHVEFSDEGSFVLLPSREEVAIIHEVNSLYQIKFSKVHVAELAALVQSSANDYKLALWHCRLGHLNVKSVQALRGMVSGMVYSIACASFFIRL